MNQLEAYIKNKSGIEMAAAFRASSQDRAVQKVLYSAGVRDTFILEWESDCMKLLGGRRYKESRSKKYSKIIDKMKGEDIDRGKGEEYVST